MGIEIYKSYEKHNEMADLQAELAKIYAEEGQKDKALEVLNEAVELYKGNRGDAKAAGLLESMAEAFAEKDEYAIAAKFFKEVSMMRLAVQLTQGSSGPLFFKAVLLSLRDNNVPATRAELEDYLQSNPTWRRDMSCQFLFHLMEAIEERDPDKFDQLLEKYKSQHSLDRWTLNRLYDLRRLADNDDGGLL